MHGHDEDTSMTILPDIPLPSGIRSRYVENINGLRMHVLEAGFETRGRPCVLLLHGFPELAFSWRKVMPVLAEAGYHVIAPDQRGYGRTTGWDPDYDGDLASFRLLNLVRDALGPGVGVRLSPASTPWSGMISARSVAAWCALVRPDVFRSVALMSAPFARPAVAAVQHRGCAAEAEAGRSRASRARGAAAAAQALSMVLLDARRPTPTCTTRRRACMISCAPITITRARTGKTTRPIRCKAGPRANWRSCRPTT